MTAISQKVPNFWQGISQQPDSKKFPGQAKDLVNGYPNFALGLQKRPGGEHVCALPQAYTGTSSSKYHHIFRDKVEKYILQFHQETQNNITLPNIKVWLLDDGIPRFVDKSELFGDQFSTLQQERHHIAFSGTPSSQANYTIDINNEEHLGTVSNVSTVQDFVTALKNLNFSGIQFLAPQSNSGDEVVIQYDYNLSGNSISISSDLQNDTFSAIITEEGGSDARPQLLSDSYLINLIATTTNGVTTGYQPTLYTAAQELNESGKTYQAAQKAYALKKREYSEIASDREQTVYFKISNDYDNGTRDQAIVDGVILQNSVYTYYRNGSVSTAPTGKTYSIGNDRTDEYPWFTGVELFELVETANVVTNPVLTATAEYTTLQSAEADYISKKTALNDVWINYTNALNSIDYFNDIRSYTDYGITAIPDNYFTGATADDIEFLTDADTTYVLNKAKTVAWDETSITPEVGDDALISINIVDGTANVYNLKYEYNTPNGIPVAVNWVVSTAQSTLAALQKTFTNLSYFTPSVGSTCQLNFLSTIVSSSGAAVGQPVTYTINFDGVAYSISSESTDAAVVGQALVDKLNEDENINAELGDVNTNVYIFVFKSEMNPATVSVTFERTDWQGATSSQTISKTNTITVNKTRTPNATPPTPLERESAVTFTFNNSSISRTFSFTILESTVHVKFGEHSNNNNNFECTISDNSPANYLSLIQHETSALTSLPLYGKHGYKVKIYNSAEVDIDDFWMEFSVENENEDFGLGNWVETSAPGIYTKIDPKTMPHVLFRQADGTFVLKPHTWDERSVGDDVTNEAPSFIGKKINNMFFYRNRFGVLAGDSIVMTRAGDFENFFNKSAMAAADDDPIDIQASSTAPVELVYAGSSAVGLVLFGTTEQFLLTTDSDLLSPATAKINSLSKFAVREDLKAQSFGATNVFFSSTDRYLKTFEMIDITNTGSPRIVEQTIQVPKLLPADLNTASSSPSNSLLSLAKKESTSMYHFKYYRTAESQVANAWYKWEFTNPILHHFYDRNTFYVVHSDNIDVLGTLNPSSPQVVKYELDDADQTGVLDNGNGLRFDPYLDMFIVEPFKTVEQVNGLYFSNFLSAGLNSDVTVVDIPLQNWENYNYYFIEKDDLGAVVDIEQVEPFGIKTPIPSTGFLASSNELIVDNRDKPYFLGDQTSRTLVIGIPYTFTLKLPTVYKIDADNNRMEADTVRNLILHRAKFETGLCGPLTYSIDVNGKDLWTNTVATTPSQSYLVSSLPVVEADTHTIPLYQRNTDLSITVSDSSLYPATLLSMTWEGRYTSKFYQ